LKVYAGGELLKRDAPQCRAVGNSSRRCEIGRVCDRFAKVTRSTMVEKES